MSDLKPIKHKCLSCGEIRLVQRQAKDKRIYYWCANCKVVDFGEKDKSRFSSEKCDQCNQGTIIQKTTSTGKLFYGCSTFPRCKNARWEKNVNESNKKE